jgi:hypothetical protein
MNKKYLLLLILLVLNLPLLAGNNEKAKDALIALFNSFASADSYSYNIQSITKINKVSIDTFKNDLIQTNAIYYFSKSKHVSYYSSKDRIFLSCKLGYFNCDEQKKLISYCLFDDDSAYQNYIKHNQDSDAFSNMDSVFFNQSEVTLKNKGLLNYYKVNYPKSLHGDYIKILYNPRRQMLESINYFITQQTESGVIVKHNVVLNHYSIHEPIALQALLLSIGGDLKTFLNQHYSDYTLVNTNGL